MSQVSNQSTEIKLPEGSDTFVRPSELNVASPFIRHSFYLIFSQNFCKAPEKDHPDFYQKRAVTPQGIELLESDVLWGVNLEEFEALNKGSGIGFKPANIPPSPSLRRS